MIPTAGPNQYRVAVASFAASGALNVAPSILTAANLAAVQAAITGIGLSGGLTCSSSGGPIANGEKYLFSGFAARSATNDVDFVVTFTDGTVVRSRFHRSCSDNDMNDITDCGKPLGDGKDNNAGSNLWLLRDLTGNNKVLGCSP